MLDVDQLPSEADILDLEPEELAAFVLQCLAKNPGGSPFSRHNVCIQVERSHKGGMKVARAILEAWSWLEREGLLVEEGQQPGWYFVSRRGYKVADSRDLERYR